MLKRTFFLVAVVFLAYLPTLFNGFIGDDHLLIEDNVFYSSWKNIPRLFEQGNIHRSKDFFSNNNDYGTGYVGYRPILSLTYFLDYGLWGDKPYGFHLTNVLIHCVNCALFYQIISSILGAAPPALLAAFLFGLHPVQSEAVAVIGYRADILATFFILCSFLFWIRFKSEGYCGLRWYAGSLITYFLALFSKESVVLLPAVIFCYDRIFASVNDKHSKQRMIYYAYAGFALVLGFYLYTYIFVFPNSALALKFLGGGVLDHILIMGHIAYLYVIGFLAPWTVKLIPGEYYPRTISFFSIEIFKTGLLFFIIAIMGVKLWKKYRPGIFFACWFLAFYFPVSNLIPVANPMAYRFMYLPSMGFLSLYALGLYKIMDSRFLKGFSRHISLMFCTMAVLVCLLCTLFINERFKDDFSVGYTMIENYPSAATGYVLMGEQYYVKGLFKQADDYFEQAVHLGYGNPQIDMQLGTCCFYLGRLKDAEKYLLKVLSVNHDYLAPYPMLVSIYHAEKKYGLEKEAAEVYKRLQNNPK